MKYGKVTVIGAGIDTRVIFQMKTGEEVSVGVNDLPEDIRYQAMAHGIKQKVADHYTTKADSPEEAERLAKEMVGRLVAGRWNERPAVRGLDDLIEALHRIEGRPRSECEEVLRKLDKAELAGVKKHPKVAAELAAIAAERADAATADDLGGLFG